MKGTRRLFGYSGEGGDDGHFEQQRLLYFEEILVMLHHVLDGRKLEIHY